MRFLFLFATLAACYIASAHPGHTDEHPPQPNKPNVVAVVYSDFHCAPCAEVKDLIDQLAKGKELPIRTLFKHTPSRQSSLEAHEASLAAAQQGKFWEMHDLLFQNRQANYSAILKMAKSLGLDMKKFQTGLDERLFRSRVVSELTEATGMGVKMTPTIFLNGQKYEGIDELRSFVSSVLAPPKPSMDPDKDYRFDFANSPSTGPTDAPITIVEFSDFRCGFCTVNSRILSEIEKLYPGKIRRVFKHFPIRMDAAGMLPHRASMAAMAQGRFWEMHEALMASPVSGSEEILQRAAAIGLDMDAFRNVLAVSKPNATMQRDIAEGDQLGIRSTPTTFINGRYISGHRSLESYQELISGILKVPQVEAGDSVIGSEDASAWIEFFVDFGDPANYEMAAMLNEFREERTDTRLQFKHFPQSKDAGVWQTHQAVASASEPRQFWQLCQSIFENETLPDGSQLQGMATRLGIDSKLLAATSQNRNRIQADVREARRRGLEGPALFLNGERFQGPYTARALATFMDERICCGK